MATRPTLDGEEITVIGEPPPPPPPSPTPTPPDLPIRGDAGSGRGWGGGGAAGKRLQFIVQQNRKQYDRIQRLASPPPFGECSRNLAQSVVDRMKAWEDVRSALVYGSV